MLHIDTISFSYQETKILEAISFSLEKGNHLSIIGESGSGKSTLLKTIYGLLNLDEGKIFWGDKQVLGPNFNLVPGEKYMKYVAQDFDLMPFTTVKENIAEFLSVFDQDNHETRIKELLEVIEMTDYANIKVKNLSGGQQQRVALARALAQEPELLLLDEPFSSIDQFKKNELRHRLFPYLKEKGITIINATHDPNDILAFADMVLVLKDGKIIAHDTIEHLYEKPKQKYIASLFGYINELPVSLLNQSSNTKASILIYPHEIKVFTTNSSFQAYVVNNYFKGNYYLVESVAENSQTVFFTHSHKLKTHNKVSLAIAPELVKKRSVTTN